MSWSALDGRPTRTACHAAKRLLNHVLSFFFHSSLFRNTNCVNEKVSAVNSNNHQHFPHRQTGCKASGLELTQSQHEPQPCPTSSGAEPCHTNQAELRLAQSFCLEPALPAHPQPHGGRQEPPSSQNFSLERHTVPV